MLVTVEVVKHYRVGKAHLFFLPSAIEPLSIPAVKPNVVTCNPKFSVKSGLFSILCISDRRGVRNLNPDGEGAASARCRREASL